MPAVLPALTNSPLAQSPMICMPAWPLITMAVARFQSRPEKLGSTRPRIVRSWSNAFAMVGLAKALLVELDEGLLVEVGPAGADHRPVEDGGLLPGLTAMGHRDHACLFELASQGDEVLPGRGLRPAHLVEQGLVHPDPVGRVHVERGRHIVALILDDVLECGRDDLVPAFLPGDRGEVAQGTLRRPVLDDETQHLHGGRRVAGGHAGLQHGAGLVATTAGNGGVLPGHTLLLQVLAQDLQGRGLAARGPPVDDLHRLRGPCRARTQGQRQRRNPGQKPSPKHHHALPSPL